MIDWYIEISDEAPDNFRTDEYLSKIIDTSTPYMDHFCKRLTEISDWKLEDANKIFQEIIEEFPILVPQIWNNEFYIRYNKWTYIKLTDSTKQIYRDIKLEKIFTEQ